MKALLNFVSLNFIPRSPDLGLLVLRVWIGTSMLMLHGLMKINKWDSMSKSFADPFGIGPKASLGLAIFAEAVCSVLLILGLFTRVAALAGAITMGVAFFIAHNMVLSGPTSGELGFIYMAAYVALFLAGPGRFSVDGGEGGGKKSSSASKPKPKKD